MYNANNKFSFDKNYLKYYYQYGLSLIELLIVITILGLTVAIIAINISKPDDEHDKYIKSLVLSLKNISDEAQINSMVFAVKYDDDKVSLLYQQKETFKQYPYQEKFLPILPQGSRLIFLASKDNYFSKDSNFSKDMMLFLPNGLIQEGELTYQYLKIEIIITIDAMGNISVKR